MELRISAQAVDVVDQGHLLVLVQYREQTCDGIGALRFWIKSKQTFASDCTVGFQTQI